MEKFAVNKETEWNNQTLSTVRPRGTRPQGTRTSLVHDFKKGSKIFEISDFGT